MKLLHIVGSRPQFFKVAAVSRAVAELGGQGTGIEERLLHSGQHYDYYMSAVFFEELALREPDYHLGVGSGTLAGQVAATLTGASAVLDEWRPDAVIVYGDTNATLGGALAAVQHHVPLAHVEAGVRTGNLHQVEELNRAVTDRICDWRFCCTELNLATLGSEGLAAGSYFTGDTMLDNYRYFQSHLDNAIIERRGLAEHKYILCTIHRAENTDYPERLGALLDTLLAIQREMMQVVLPLHPRTRTAIDGLGRGGELKRAGVIVTEPLGYRDTQALLAHSHLVLSDSGGLLREAYFAGRYCVIPWEYAAWPELVEAGWAVAGAVERGALLARLEQAPAPREPEVSGLFGDGNAGRGIVEIIKAALA